MIVKLTAATIIFNKQVHLVANLKERKAKAKIKTRIKRESKKESLTKSILNSLKIK